MFIRNIHLLKEQSPWLQLLFFGFVTLLSLFVATAIGYLVPIITDGSDALNEALGYLAAPETIPEEYSINLIRILSISQIIAQIGLFIVPPLLFVRLLYGREGMSVLKLTQPSTFTLLLVVPLTLMVLPMVGWLHDINMQVTLTPKMELAEERAALFVNLFFNDASWGRFALNMLMIAIIPAIGEELFFRGVLQKYLGKGLKNVHLAVFLTAIIFSFFHFQFYGFLPRLFLGVLFGYLFVWSGNLWLPILAHLVNNGGAVLVAFLAQRGVIGTSYEDFGKETGTGVLVAAIGITAALCYAIWFHHKRQPLGNTPEIEQKTRGNEPDSG